MMAKIYEQIFPDEVELEKLDPTSIPTTLDQFMQIAIDTALAGMTSGQSKEREPFAAIVVKNDKIIAVRLI